MQLRFRRTSPLRYAIYIVASFGFALVFFVLERLFADPVVEVDDAGLTTRKRRRFPWTSLRDVRVQAEYHRRGGPNAMPLFWGVTFEFEGATIRWSPILYEDGLGALAFVEKTLGRSIGRPMTRRDYYLRQQSTEPSR